MSSGKEKQDRLGSFYKPHLHFTTKQSYLLGNTAFLSTKNRANRYTPDHKNCLGLVQVTCSVPFPYNLLGKRKFKRAHVYVQNSDPMGKFSLNWHEIETSIPCKCHFGKNGLIALKNSPTVIDMQLLLLCNSHI